MERLKWILQKEDEIKPFTEGEEIIARFLDDLDIKWELITITNLQSDNSAYRKPDFYLPKFDMCIEFFGRWNTSEKEKERYREKKRIYELNNIPCIYLYPENLGILAQLFFMRIEDEMEARKMKMEMIKYQYFNLKDEFRDSFLYFYLAGAFLFLWFTRNLDSSLVIAFRSLNIAIPSISTQN